MQKVNFSPKNSHRKLLTICFDRTSGESDFTPPTAPHPPLRHTHHQHLGGDLAIGFDVIHSDDPKQAQQQSNQSHKHDKLHPYQRHNSPASEPLHAFTPLSASTSCSSSPAPAWSGKSCINSLAAISALTTSCLSISCLTAAILSGGGWFKSCSIL